MGFKDGSPDAILQIVRNGVPEVLMAPWTRRRTQDITDPIMLAQHRNRALRRRGPVHHNGGRPIRYEKAK